MAKELDGGVTSRKSATGIIRDALQVMDPGNLIEQLRPDCRTYFRGVLLSIGMIGFGKARVISTLRPLEEQQRLYGRGRTREECEAVGVPAKYADPRGTQVTWCLPEESKHVQARAMDIDLSGYAADTLSVLGHVARSFRCTWGGAWRVRDYGHFEV